MSTRATGDANLSANDSRTSVSSLELLCVSQLSKYRTGEQHPVCDPSVSAQHADAACVPESIRRCPDTDTIPGL